MFTLGTYLWCIYFNFYVLFWSIWNMNAIKTAWITTITGVVTINIVNTDQSLILMRYPLYECVKLFWSFQVFWLIRKFHHLTLEALETLCLSAFFSKIRICFIKWRFYVDLNMDFSWHCIQHGKYVNFKHMCYWNYLFIWTSPKLLAIKYLNLWKTYHAVPCSM